MQTQDGSAAALRRPNAGGSQQSAAGRRSGWRIAKGAWHVLRSILRLPWGLADILALLGVLAIVATVWGGCVALNQGDTFAESDPLVSSIVAWVPASFYGRIPATKNGAEFLNSERVQLAAQGVSPGQCQGYDEGQYQLHAYACSYNDGSGWNVFFFFRGKSIGTDTLVKSRSLYLSGRTGSEITVFYNIYQNKDYTNLTGESRSVTFLLETDGKCPSAPNYPRVLTCMTPEQDQDIPPLATWDSPGR